MTVAGPCHCRSVVNLHKTLPLGLNTTSQYFALVFAWTNALRAAAMAFKFYAIIELLVHPSSVGKESWKVDSNFGFCAMGNWAGVDPQT